MKSINESPMPKRIKKLRLDRHMTQKELAYAIDVSKGYISRIENSGSAPPIGILVSLAKIFEVNFTPFLILKSLNIDLNT